MDDTRKGLVYSLSNNTLIDKKTGEEKGMINIHYIYQNDDETATKLGWYNGQAWFTFTDDLWKELKSILLKNVDLHFKWVSDYNDPTRASQKLIKINDLDIKKQ